MCEWGRSVLQLGQGPGSACATHVTAAKSKLTPTSSSLLPLVRPSFLAHATYYTAQTSETESTSASPLRVSIKQRKEHWRVRLAVNPPPSKHTPRSLPRVARASPTEGELVCANPHSSPAPLSRHCTFSHSFPSQVALVERHATTHSRRPTALLRQLRAWTDTHRDTSLDRHSFELFEKKKSLQRIHQVSLRRSSQASSSLTGRYGMVWEILSFVPDSGRRHSGEVQTPQMA